MNSAYYPQMPHGQWQGVAYPTAPGAPYGAPPYYPASAAAPGYYPGYYYPPTAALPAPAPSTGVLGNPRFVRGVLIGAAAAYLLTNEDVQQAAIRSVVRVWSLVQGGVEEMKERFRDAEAELHAAQGD